MRTITLHQPRRLVIGPGCLQDAVAYLLSLEQTRWHIVTSPSLESLTTSLAATLQEHGRMATVDASIAVEPTIAKFYQVLAHARQQKAEGILGLGGGSALDLSKLVAAFLHSTQTVEEVFGIGLLAERTAPLVCLPTTAGTGSEVSPNAILLDEAARLKKGVVSTHLVPDASFIDPVLARDVPPTVTAFTGLDAPTHCIEAFTNKFAHPLVDTYALRGISLCAEFLPVAVKDGANIEAREAMALASMLGGLCLGPVNTAAVHALAYPLGGEFHVPHGLSNAVLLPPVFRFNAEAAPGRHAAVAIALGAQKQESDLATAFEGARLLERLVDACGVSRDLSQYGVTADRIPSMAEAALTVQRLLVNNPRAITRADAEHMYGSLFAG